MEAILMLAGALIAGLFVLAAVHDQNRRGRRHSGADGSIGDLCRRRQRL